MGIWYDNIMGEDQFKKTEVADRQNLITDTLVIDGDIPENTDYQGAEEIEYRIEYHDIVRTDNHMQAGQQAVISIYPDIDKLTGSEGELYIEFKSLYPQEESLDDVSVNEKVFSICNDDYVYRYGTNDYLVKLDASDKIEIGLTAAHAYTSDDIKIYWYDTEQNINKTDDRKTLQDIEFSDWKLEGNITSGQDGWLFLSIPYDTNWKAYVDDTPTEIYKGQIGFMAVAMEAGEHNVTLVYKPVWFIIGVICSITAAVSCILIYLYERYMLGKNE